MKVCRCPDCGATVTVPHGSTAYCRRHLDRPSIMRAATWWICEDGRTADEPPADRGGKVWRKFVCAWLVSELGKGTLCPAV